MAEEQRPAWGMAATRQLDDWLAILPDGTVVVWSGKVEVGTGIRTSLAQIVAEELEVPLGQVRMVMGDTERTPNEGYTSGSMTIRTSGALLRKAAAEARLALLEQAAERLGAAPAQLELWDGTVRVRGEPERRIGYGELQGGRPFQRLISEQPPVKSREEYRLVGTAAPRSDLSGKFTGAASFVHDLRLPDMLHGRILRSRNAGSRLVSLDQTRVTDAEVVRLGNFVGVVAEREEQAIKALAQLDAEWEELPSLPPMAELFDWMRSQPTADQVVDAAGDVNSALAGATKRVHAVYRQPFQAHASLGPSCAVAAFSEGKLTVWCSSGGVYPLRGALCDLLELPPSQVHVIYMDGAGAYGHNGSEDVAADAALLARAVGQPVRVQWSRADEFAGEPKAAAMLMEAYGGLDEEGRIVVWDYQVWTSTHVGRPRQALGLLAGRELRGETPPSASFFFGGDRNAPVDYAVADRRVTMHWLAQPPLRTSSMRSLGGAGNTFANESFMDELAAAAETDPLDFRLRHIADPRAVATISAAARAALWGSPLPEGEGRGLAFARYENSEAYVATVAQVSVDEQSGALRLRRVVVAHDCGLIINPDGVRNQIEGNVLQAASRALKEEVHFDAYGQTSLDWESYPILTFSEAPAVEIVLIDRPDQPPVGAGEPATVTVAAAIANAVYAATGARLRQVPFTAERVRAALASR
ncbi:MAG: molybdopterin cofactor-binding domain-containing protein [Ktedonobacterales bacterium]